MKIDMTNEHPITLKEVPKHVPKRRGKKVHYSTVYRWATKGVRGKVLETVMVGGIRYTTIEAIRRFLQTNNTKAPRQNVSINAAIDQVLSKVGL